MDYNLVFLRDSVLAHLQNERAKTSQYKKEVFRM